MNVNYDYYRIFYYVAKCGNLSQAARELVNNQPNLTRSIKNLEAELGCTLFSRTNRGMKLTPEGERLYRHVKIAVEQLEAGEAELAQSRSLQADTVFLAASEGALRCVLLPVLEAFRTQYPGVSLRISNHSTPQAIAALRETTADFAVVTTPVLHAAAFQQTNIRQIQEVAVCSPSFRDLLDRTVTLEELRTHPLITLGADTQSYALYSGFFAAHGLPFRPDIEAFTAEVRFSRWSNLTSALASSHRILFAHPTMCASLILLNRFRRAVSASLSAKISRSASPPRNWKKCWSSIGRAIYCRKMRVRILVKIPFADLISDSVFVIVQIDQTN